MNTEALKLSVIIPSFNSGSTLEQTLDSIIKQNYPNLELIVIDGNSNDNSVSIIKNYATHISYWISEDDSGQSNAINKGLSIASGDYVSFMNADDLYLDGAFNQLNLLCKSVPYDFIFGNVLLGKNLENANVVPNVFSSLDLSKLLLFFFNVRFIVPSQSVWIKRRFLIKNGLNKLDESLAYCMDLEWYCRISLFDPKTHKIAHPNSFFRLAGNTKTLINSKAMKEESLQVAYKYVKYLTAKQRRNWFKYLLFDRILRKVYHKKIKNSLILHFWLIRKTGMIAMHDKRFMGLIKSSI